MVANVKKCSHPKGCGRIGNRVKIPDGSAAVTSDESPNKPLHLKADENRHRGKAGQVGRPRSQKTCFFTSSVSLSPTFFCRASSTVSPKTGRDAEDLGSVHFAHSHENETRLVALGSPSTSRAEFPRLIPSMRALRAENETPAVGAARHFTNQKP